MSKEPPFHFTKDRKMENSTGSSVNTAKPMKFGAMKDSAISSRLRSYLVIFCIGCRLGA